jgi:hypothetical protein
LLAKSERTNTLPLLVKRQWERIVNREPPHIHVSSNVHASSSVVGGLKEGVRILAAGLSDLSDITSPTPAPDPAGASRRHAQRESDSSTSIYTGSRHDRLSTSSVSSVWDGDTSPGKDMEDWLTKRSQAQDDKVARARQAKVFRRRSRDVSHPPPSFIRHATACNSTSTSVDIASTPCVVQDTSNTSLDPFNLAMGISTSGVWEHDADGPEFSGTPSKNARHSTPSLPPPSSMPGVGSFTVVGEAWGTVGRKLGSDV